MCSNKGSRGAASAERKPLLRACSRKRPSRSGLATTALPQPPCGLLLRRCSWCGATPLPTALPTFGAGALPTQRERELWRMLGTPDAGDTGVL